MPLTCQPAGAAYWQERFGAEITGMSGDVIECAVLNPPTDRNSATALAWVHVRQAGALLVVGLAVGAVLNTI